MLCYYVSNCDCCGKMCINHDDNLLEKKNNIKRSHLTKKNVMFGKVVVIKLMIVKTLFTQNPTQMSYYRIHHGGKAP